ncbi:MAG: 4Fe-4S ferredoxin [Deltaproteobacteria bacterium]|nr:4Fe-4S ferredoxin [Deltaproteobacteria bacterium]
MTDNSIYKKLARVLDTLPNGFPATETGVEIKILKKIFTPDEADLFCDLRLTFETPRQISERTGRSLDGLAEQLEAMWNKGQLFGIDFGEVKVFKMIPWVLGIYEYQVKSMDKEFARLCDEYNHTFGKEFFKYTPHLMQVVPIEKEIENNQATLPYEQVSTIIENGQSFAVNECICKKEKKLLGNPCDKPLEVCMAIAPVPGVFENNHPWGGRVISKDEAYEVLKKSEEAGLVHLSSNIQNGQYYICNCCGCCCGVLRSVNEFGFSEGVNSHFYAMIDEESCTGCGICSDERCQINAIEEKEEAYSIIQDRCIGCGLCISTCPEEAIVLRRKEEKDCVVPPADENEWFKHRAAIRGVDYSAHE